MRQLHVLALLTALALGTGACAKARPGHVTPPYRIAFEHFEMRETLALKREVERHFPGPARVDDIGGSDGHMEIAVATDASPSRVHDSLVAIVERRGYDLDTVKVTALDGGYSLVVDRIVDTGYRPGR